MNKLKIIATKEKSVINTPCTSFLKIIVGPSSSHTFGPYLIGKSIRKKLEDFDGKIEGIKVHFYNSMSKTGVGHFADFAIIGGLLSVELSELTKSKDLLGKNNGNLNIPNKNVIFDISRDLLFHKGEHPDKHENGIGLTINSGLENEQTFNWKSIGGGVIDPPYQVVNYELLPPSFQIENWMKFKYNANKFDGPIIGYILGRDEELKPEVNHMHYMRIVYKAMIRSVEHGLALKETMLPGNIISTQAHWQLYHNKRNNDQTFSLAGIYARAAAENSANCGEIVTAPTAGGGGVLPGIIAAMKEKSFVKKDKNGIAERKLIQSLFLAGLVGQIFQKNTTVAGAVGGCTFEVGVGAAMAAAASLYAHLEDTAKPKQKAFNLDLIETTMMNVFEKWIGFQLDPVGGRVEIPCIQRNSDAAEDVRKVVSIALQRPAYLAPLLGFDRMIAYAYELGKTLPSRYRETSEGGIATLLIKSPYSKRNPNQNNEE